MKTIELARTNGTAAQVTIGYTAGDALENPSVFAVKTPEFELKEATLMTKSDVKLYADCLKECTAVVGGRIFGEPSLIACIRLDEVNFAKLKKEMNSEFEAAAVSSPATAGSAR